MSRGVYLNPPDYRRAKAALLQAIAISRRNGKCEFPCEVLGARARRNFACTIICPVRRVYTEFYEGLCRNGRNIEFTHEEWVLFYRRWLRIMSKTFEDARQELEKWGDFVRLDVLLMPDNAPREGAREDFVNIVLRKMEEWEDEDKRVDTD